MKSFAIGALAILGSIVGHAYCADRAPLTHTPSPAIRAEALKVCAMGQESLLFVHAADACWTAFTLSLDTKNYVDALQSVKYGCEKYGRGDYCLFLASLGPQFSRFVAVSAGAEQAGLGEALQRAAVSVNALDIFEAELGIAMRMRNNAQR